MYPPTLVKLLKSTYRPTRLRASYFFENPSRTPFNVLMRGLRILPSPPMVNGVRSGDTGAMSRYGGEQIQLFCLIWANLKFNDLFFRAKMSPNVPNFDFFDFFNFSTFLVIFGKFRKILIKFFLDFFEKFRFFENLKKFKMSKSHFWPSNLVLIER